MKINDAIFNLSVVVTRNKSRNEKVDQKYIKPRNYMESEAAFNNFQSYKIPEGLKLQVAIFISLKQDVTKGNEYPPKEEKV